MASFIMKAFIKVKSVRNTTLNARVVKKNYYDEIRQNNLVLCSTGNFDKGITKISCSSNTGNLCERWKRFSARI